MSQQLKYLFGYGADREPDMIKAIIGHNALDMGEATVSGYGLYVQKLADIPLPARTILQKSWGNSFISYVIKPLKGSKVYGRLFSINNAEIKQVDIWELVDCNWYDIAMITATTLGDGKQYNAHTQAIPITQQTEPKIYTGPNYNSWLMPKSDFIKIAQK